MSMTKSPSKVRPPMILFLVIKFVLIWVPMSIIFAAVMIKAGASEWVGIPAGFLLAWWVKSKYEEILIEVVDYIREKYDQDPK